ncbi:sulfite exporter TauE/SafE family protein [Oceanospirillum linum]|uniref:Probable membrane transporter protein n=1 Tax=Oceanospirillum linum TaxID=966 RepID=A0A1T1HBD7_OCELI|nr:sulfite exporter TauE/SafE family protein [Oceanospirillum linum]OOV87070.1 hypothetical protein BTA35_0208665 [Oceanospirillum linum]SEF73489.1 hypothetical protein SAMN04489856_102131 [Oleiphilus messinensis]SMP16347.1 hypothetical protein SAMN06264348_103129 [Oceanospirillum linum]
MVTLLMYVALGGVAGTLAGLFGIGGGLVIVPVLVFSFAAQGISPEVLTHLAVGTSLATIVVTSVSSVKAHHGKGAVRWDWFTGIAIGIVFGTVLGVKTAGMMSGELLQKVIGVFALLIAVQMGFGLKPKPGRTIPGRPGLIGAGGFIGWASAIFGIGGGSLTVPFLSWCNVKMQTAVATSAAVGLPIAIVGALANIEEGWGHPLLPEYATGYVYWPAFIGIVSTSVIFAKVGAKLAHSLPSDTLKRIFAVLLLLIGIRFLLS